jgi:hypothetical protein
MSESFKKHNLSKAEILWMKEAYITENFDPKVAKVKLRNKLPKGFNPKNIDSRLLVDGKNLTVLGLWYVDPHAPHFDTIEKVILGIRDLIIEQPGFDQITSDKISDRTGIDKPSVEIALSNISFFGKFFSASQKHKDSPGIDSIRLSNDDSYDAYLEFESIDQLLEETYVRFGKTREHKYKFVNATTTGYWSPSTTYKSSQPGERVEDENKLPRRRAAGY